MATRRYAFLILWCLLTCGAWAETAPPDFHMIYEYDSGQRVPTPYRFRVTLDPGHGVFTRWDSQGEKTRETKFPLTGGEEEGIYQLAVSTQYFGLTGGVPAATLDSPSQWVALTAGHRSLTVWAQTSGNRVPAALEALSHRVRDLLSEQVYDWQTTPGAPHTSLISPFAPLTVDTQHGEVGYAHLGDPPEAVEAVWGHGSSAVAAHASRGKSTDYYDPGEPSSSLLTVEYVDGRAGTLRLNLSTPTGRELSGSVDILNGAQHLQCDIRTTPQKVLAVLGPPNVKTVGKDGLGTLQYGRLVLYFYQGLLRWVELAGTMENVGQAFPGDMPGDFQVCYWKRFSHDEQVSGSLYGYSVQMTLRGGVRTQVDMSNHVEQGFFQVDAADLRDFYRLLQHSGFFSMGRTWPETPMAEPPEYSEGDEGVLVWSQFGVYRSDVLGFKGHDVAPPALLQIFAVAQRMAKGHVLPHH